MITSQFPRLAIPGHIAMCWVGISTHIIMWVLGLVERNALDIGRGPVELAERVSMTYGVVCLRCLRWCEG